MERLAFEDPRVPLAAERTLLSWVRTGLAMMGFGFVVARLGLFLHELGAIRGAPPPADSGRSAWIGAGIAALGAIVLLTAALRHVRLMRQLAAGGPYRPTVWSQGVIVSLVLAVLGLAVAAQLLTRVA